jgi:hypothetical protein
MPISSLSKIANNELAKGFIAKERPIIRSKEDIKYIVQQHYLTINNETKTSKNPQYTSTGDKKRAAASAKSCNNVKERRQRPLVSAISMHARIFRL